jgi:trehalose 6-phosphate phosphatase
MTGPLLDNLLEISARISCAPHILLCSDFDGTLAPIADEPSTAGLSLPIRRVLRKLAANERISVAIVSGRELADVRKLVGIPGLIYAGNHGLEISGAGFFFIEPTAASFIERLETLAADLGRGLQHIPGAIVENKGLTLSIHDRLVAEENRREVFDIVCAAVRSALLSLKLTAGNRVHEVRPPVEWNKGIAVRWIAEKIAKPGCLIVYIGDDVTDEDAFAALPDGVTVKVGNQLPTAAQYKLDGPERVQQFLEWVDLQTLTA